MNKRLKSVNVTFTHYDELENFIMTIEKLIKHCENLNNVYDKMYKIYFNN